jgi:hypothetical protein
MTRRVGALFGIAILVALVLVLIWNVYRHRELMHEPDESAVVRLDGRGARAVVIFAPPFC